MAFSLGGMFGVGGSGGEKRTPGALAKKMGTDFGGMITSADGKTPGSATPAPGGLARKFGPEAFGGRLTPITGGLAGIKKLMPTQQTPMAQPVKPQMPMAPTATPAPAMPGGVPSVPGAAMSTINPAQDLRSQAITPNNSQAPNLTALAQQKFQDFMAGTADERQQGIRQIGQSAAKFGRIGAGMTTNQLTSLEDLMQRRENEAARGLASDVAISDLGEQRAQRDELRGERGYQYGASRDALGDRVQQRLLEEQLLNSQFGRDVTRTSLGYQGNPSGVQMDASRDYGQSANDALGGVGEYLGNKELMAALLEYQKKQKAPPGGIVPQVPNSAPIYDSGGY